MPPRSRATRNQDAARSRQGQVLDLDPTDGLPVQRYALMTVKVNQDASADTLATNAKSTNSAEWEAQFETPQYPWREARLPSFYREVPAWNQEMIRRARTGNTSAKLSVWDRKNNCWMSAAEAEKKATPLKSMHLNNLGPSADADAKMANGDAASQKSGDEMDENDSSNESNKSVDEDEEDAEDGAPFNMKPTSLSKKRKLASRLHGTDDTRLIEVKRWVQLPPNIAEKTPERSFLAARRPGMPPLYQPEYAQKMFGRYHSSSTISGTAGYDLGEGGGLSNASGVLAAGSGDATAGTATPPRKNIPPRRKKKKLGGPGRRKANPNPLPTADGTTDPTAPGAAAGQTDGSAMQGVVATGDNTPAEGEAAAKDEAAGEDDNNESGSEAEGSEEGEIDESGGAGNTTSQPPQQAAQADIIGRIPAQTLGAAATKSAAPDNVPTVAAGDLVPAPSVTDMPMARSTTVQPSIGLEEHSKKESLGAKLNPEPEGAPAPIATVSESIPGLGALEEPAKNAEEKQIADENAQAIATTTEPAKEQIAGGAEAIQAVAAAPTAEKEKTASGAETEVDLLGGLDAAIDQGMNEGS